jgi:hypothetical protein
MAAKRCSLSLCHSVLAGFHASFIGPSGRSAIVDGMVLKNASMPGGFDQPGSWWPAWTDWLVRHSGTRAAPPPLAAAAAGYVPLGEAPGTDVLQS